MVADSPKKFANLVNKYSYLSYIDKPNPPHTNITFFLGAGFSKAWDKSYPSADDLFKIPENEMLFSHGTIYGAFDERLQAGFDLITPDVLKETIYRLNMELKYPAIRSRYFDENSLRLTLARVRSLIAKTLIEMAPIDYVGPNSPLIQFTNKKIDSRKRDILSFFKDVAYHEDGSRGYPSGVRINFITTNYDMVIETILDMISSSTDEPHYLYTYKGITPNLICGEINPALVHDHRMAHTLIKVNGGIEILPSENGGYNFEYRRRGIEKILEKPPIIMLPSREQDYQDDYFRSIFPKAVRLLRESKILVIIGYSFPDDDALLRFLLRQFAEHDRDLRDKNIFYIDVIEEEKQIRNLKKCFPYLYYTTPSEIFAFSGDFRDWCKLSRDNFCQVVEDRAYKKVTEDRRSQRKKRTRRGRQKIES